MITLVPLTHVYLETKQETDTEEITQRYNEVKGYIERLVLPKMIILALFTHHHVVPVHHAVHFSMAHS